MGMLGVYQVGQGRSTSLQWRQKPQSASWMGTSFSRKRTLMSANFCSSYFWPVTASTSSLRLPEAQMASLAPLRMTQLCFSPKAASQALARMSGRAVLRLRISSKVTRMKVNSHIILSRLRAVELYFLNSLGAFRSLLLSPLQRWIFFSISISTNAKKPSWPGYVRLLALMMATFSLTSEKAIPRKEFSSLNTTQNSSSTRQNSSKAISPLEEQVSQRRASWTITSSTSNFSFSFLSFPFYFYIAIISLS